MNFDFQSIIITFISPLIGFFIAGVVVKKIANSNERKLEEEVKVLKEQMKGLLECFDVKVEKKIVTIPPPLIWYGCIPEERDEIQVTKTYTLKRSAIEEGNKIVFGDDGCTLIVKGVTKVKPKTKPKKK